MKILLINPDNTPSAGRDLYTADITTSFIHFNPFKKHFFGLPLALPTLAGLTPDNHRVRIIDEAIEPIDFGEDCDLVGITGMTFKAKRAYEIAEKFRKCNKPVIMGGIHATTVPDEVAKHVDCVVIGEADELWPQILADFEGGHLKRCYRMDELPRIDRLPPPNYQASQYKRYATIFLQTARGCPFACPFCTVTQISGRHMRFKSSEQVIREIDEALQLKALKRCWTKRRSDGKYLRYVGHLFFVDDNFAINKQHALKICKSIQEYQTQRGIYFEWSTQLNFMVGLDEDLLKALTAANCRQLFMGFESLAEEGLRCLNKGMNTPEKYVQSIQNARKYGMEVVFSTILGSDADTSTCADELIEFIEKNSLFYVLPNILTPYPGTRLYRELENEGRILTKDYDLYNIRNVVFAPKRMSAYNLQFAYTRLVENIFSFENQFRRGTKAFRLTPYDHQMNWIERLGSLILFVYTALFMALTKKIQWGSFIRVFNHAPAIFLRHGTLKSLWVLIGVAIDYHDFSQKESRRFRSNTVQRRLLKSKAPRL